MNPVEDEHWYLAYVRPDDRCDEAGNGVGLICSGVERPPIVPIQAVHREKIVTDECHRGSDVRVGWVLGHVDALDIWG